MAALSNLASQFAAARRTVAPQPGSPTPPPPPPSGGAGNVVLTNAAGPAVAGVPVTTGIPFATGVLFDMAQLRLEDPTTTAQRDAQFDSLAQWPDGSHKAVQVNFVADVGASATTHRLVYGTGASRTTNSVVIGATQNSGITTVSDGTVTVVIDAKGNLTSASRSGSQILGAQEVGMVEAAVAAREFTSTNSADAVVTIEENGPTRVVIRARGTLRSSGGVNYIQYVSRYYIYAGTGVIDVDDTFVDETSTSNENSGIPLTLSHASRSVFRRGAVTVDGTPQYRFGGEVGSGAVHSGNVSGEHYQHQTGSFPWTLGSGVPAPGHTFAYAGVGTGTYASGFVNLQGSTGSRRVGIFMKDMWQNYPMELNLNVGTFDLRYWSGRGIGSFDTSAPSNPQFVSSVYTRPNSFYMRSSGIAKTYRARFNLHSAAKSDTELHQENTLFQRNNLECMAPQQWYFDSKVWGNLKAIDAEAATGQVAWFLRSNIRPNITNMLPTQSGGQSGSSTSAGGGTMFGWRDYGDRARIDTDAPYFQQDTHIGADKHLELYLMTGAIEFWQLGFIATQHYMDIDIRHNPCIPYANYGAPASNAPAGGTRYTGHSALDHESDHDFSEHYHVSGMPTMYLLTGCKRSKEVLLETGAWIKYISQYTHKLPFTLTDRYREADRYFGYPLIGMAQYNKAIVSRDYHVNAVAKAATYFLQWWKTSGPHFGWNPATSTIVYGASPSPYSWPTGTPIGTNDYTQGTGMWGCQRADNSYGGAGNFTTGTSPWFTFPSLSGCILFREQELAWIAAGYEATVNMTEFNMMLFQVLDYVIKYCYDDTVSRFCYSEVARPSNGFSTPGDSAGSAHNMLGVYAMLYITRLYDAELAGGRIANPEWFNRTKWGTLNTQFVNMMRNTSATTNTQPYSPYGYEHPWPNAFWKDADDMGL